MHIGMIVRRLLVVKEFKDFVVRSFGKLTNLETTVCASSVRLCSNRISLVLDVNLSKLLSGIGVHC